jgi:hypothetical protein
LLEHLKLETAKAISSQAGHTPEGSEAIPSGSTDKRPEARGSLLWRLMIWSELQWKLAEDQE